MAFALADVIGEIEQRLAAAVDAATWTQAMKEQGTRAALEVYSLRGPCTEVSVAAAAGQAQDLGASVAGLLAVEAVAWPWHDGDRFEQRAARFRVVEPPGRVVLEGVAPAAGETLRVRCRVAHTVAGLDGAAETSVPDAHRALLGLGAALATAQVRLRQIGENPALPREAAALLAAWCADAEAEFAWRLERLGGGERTLVWPGVGL
jgi:hypothetical protein